MSEKMTRIRIPVSGIPGYMVRGHVSYDDAIAEAKRYFETQLDQATKALDALRQDKALVTHQRGVYRAHDVRTVVNPHSSRLWLMENPRVSRDTYAARLRGFLMPWYD